MAIFPVLAVTICPAAVSQIGRTPLVGNTDLLLQAAAIFSPLPRPSVPGIWQTAAAHWVLSKDPVFFFQIPKWLK